MRQSRSPSPLSSGEVSSGSEEKAISTMSSHAQDSRVNKSARLHSGSSSRDPAVIRAQENMYRLSTDPNFHFRNGDDDLPRSHRNRSPRCRDDRSRSRSPWRPGKPTRGEKRAQAEDHYSRVGNSDPRRFKVHYENPNLHPLGARPEQSRSAAPRQNLQSKGGEHVQYHQPRPGNHHVQRGRNRSRSPFRHPKSTSQDRSCSPFRNNNNNNNNNASSLSGSKYGRHNERESTPNATTTDTTPKAGSTQSQGVGFSDSNPGNDHAALRKEQQPEEKVEEAQTQLSDAELIERRRKMREAIKAKHRNNPPLLVQALEHNVPSAPPTPLHDSSGVTSEQQSPPTSHGSPATAPQDSPPVSPAPFVVNDDEELVEHRGANETAQEEDGPSAADYDPNLDMQEDRPDHKRQDLHAGPAESADDNEPTGESNVPAPKKEFDMFAEDDDDMFAPATSTNKAPASSTIQARALDASLLDNWDYPDGHYRIILGELLDGRYVVQQQIGKGTFATVVRAQDTRTGQLVAIKIACNNQTMYKAGQKEMDMLRILNDEDPDDRKHIIRLLRNFDHKEHLCLVFESLSADLREILKKFGRNTGLNLRAIRSYAQQMLMALSHLKTCKILHADLKPDNILVSEKRNLLKVCDLGTASHARDAEITPYLVSRFYRAPEVILGMEFDYAIDMWSVGCTLFELYTGRIMFAGADNNQMLRAIQECRGKIPNRILKRSSLVDKHFDVDGNFISQDRDRLTGKASIRQLNFNKIAPGKDLRSRLSVNVKDMDPDEVREHTAFVDLMERCLQLDPQRRMSPNEALRHNFITHVGKGEKATVKLAMNVPRKV